MRKTLIQPKKGKMRPLRIRRNKEMAEIQLDKAEEAPILTQPPNQHEKFKDSLIQPKI